MRGQERLISHTTCPQAARKHRDSRGQAVRKARIRPRKLTARRSRRDWPRTRRFAPQTTRPRTSRLRSSQLAKVFCGPSARLVPGSRDAFGRLVGRWRNKHSFKGGREDGERGGHVPTPLRCVGFFGCLPYSAASSDSGSSSPLTLMSACSTRCFAARRRWADSRSEKPRPADSICWRRRR